MGLLLKSLAPSPPRQISDSTSALEEGRQAAMQVCQGGNCGANSPRTMLATEQQRKGC